MNSADNQTPEAHPFYPMNIGPLTHNVAGVGVPKWIELENHTVLVPVDIMRPADTEKGERAFERWPGVVFGVCTDPTSIMDEDPAQAGPDADAWRATHTTLDG